MAFPLFKRELFEDRTAYSILGATITVPKLHIKKRLKYHICFSAPNKKTFAPYHNKHKNDSIVIVATGPTLNDYVPILGALHIGVNGAVQHSKINFDYLFVQYPATFDKYKEDFKNYSCEKFLGIHSFSRKLANYESKEINAKKYFTSFGFSKEYFPKDLTSTFIADFHSVTFAALQFALWTSPKKIYLVGCDCTNLGYFDPKQGENFEMAEHLPYMKEGWKKFKEFLECEYPEIEIISVNPVYLKNVFQDIYTNSKS